MYFKYLSSVFSFCNRLCIRTYGFLNSVDCRTDCRSIFKSWMHLYISDKLHFTKYFNAVKPIADH